MPLRLAVVLAFLAAQRGHAQLKSKEVAHEGRGSVRGSSGSTTNATRGVEDWWRALSSDAWMAEFCSMRCRAEGYCCNDYKVGANQMISCAQACMMRARGSSVTEMLASKQGHCQRHPASGCSLEVNGYRYTFCAVCSDINDTPKCKLETPDACNFGASLAPPTPAEYCSLRCKAEGFCCNDWKVGSNQMISCAQACMMRTWGAPWQQLVTERSGLCDRHGGSGCSLEVGGREYTFCSECGDLTGSPKCRHGVASPAACDFGASLPPSRWGVGVWEPMQPARNVGGPPAR